MANKNYKRNMLVLSFILIFVLGILLILKSIPVNTSFSNSTDTNNSLKSTNSKKAESGDIKLRKAVEILQSIPEINAIENRVKSTGGSTFYTNDGESGDDVIVSLRERFPEDDHTVLITSFNVNPKTREITINDISNNSVMSVEDWLMKDFNSYK